MELERDIYTLTKYNYLYAHEYLNLRRLRPYSLGARGHPGRRGRESESQYRIYGTGERQLYTQ